MIKALTQWCLQATEFIEAEAGLVRAWMKKSSKMLVVALPLIVLLSAGLLLFFVTSYRWLQHFIGATASGFLVSSVMILIGGFGLWMLLKKPGEE